jgi:hypothetical protein
MPGDDRFAFDLLSIELGEDDDGDAVTSAVVNHLPDEPNAKHGEQVGEAIQASARHKDTLAKGQAILDTHGTDDGPDDQRVAKVGEWRAAVLEGVPEERRDAKRKEFDRHLKELSGPDGRVRTDGEGLDRFFWFPLT